MAVAAMAAAASGSNDDSDRNGSSGMVFIKTLNKYEQANVFHGSQQMYPAFK